MTGRNVTHPCPNCGELVHDGPESWLCLPCSGEKASHAHTDEEQDTDGGWSSCWQGESRRPSPDEPTLRAMLWIAFQAGARAGRGDA